jgi:hypothetical protein
LPVENSARYRRIRTAIETEFLNTFGGCTVIRGAKGLYLSDSATLMTDDIDLVYVDTPFNVEAENSILSSYTDSLRQALLEATSEESILIVVHEIFHSN